MIPSIVFMNKVHKKLDLVRARRITGMKIRGGTKKGPHPKCGPLG